MTDPLDTTAITDLTRQHAAHIETTFLQAILATDWDDTPVLDIIIAHPTPQLTTTHTDDTSRQSIHGLDTHIEVTRHTQRAPPLAEVSIPNRRCDIYRITEPLLEHHRDALELAGYNIDALL